MASEEEGSPLSAGAAAAAASAVPPYPEMILAAIDAIDDKNGANKTAISKYIETNYENLPEGHTMLLAHHLNNMKDAGELSFGKNSYSRPDPSAPPKRGRGRPPKPKAPLPPGYVAPSPRPRGRPPKPKDALASAAKKASGGPPRPRGRPPKKARPAAAPAPAPASPSPASPTPPGVKRGRGRPPKVKPAVTAVGA